jgi:site-specific recombinase XerD
MNMAQVEEWLAGIPAKQTRKSYKNSIRKFEEWLGKPIESLLNNPDEATKAIERFFCYLKEKFCQNTARNQTNGVIQYFKAHKTEVKPRRALNIYHTVVSVRDHPLNIVEIQQMSKHGDLREQVLLKVGLLGLRVGDVANLHWQTFDVQGETPIEIEIVTKKEDVVARTFIDAELKELLDLYLPTLDPKNPFLFQNKQNGNLSEKRIDEILKQLFERAGLKTQKILRWHCFRKLALRTSSELGLNQWSAKILVGKSVPSDIMTYISGLNLKEDFNKLSNVLKLKGNSNGNGKVRDLENAVKQIESENMTFKTRIDLLQKEVQTLKKSMEGLYHIIRTYPTTVTHTLFNKKTGKREDYSETVNTPEEMEASLKRFEEKVKKLAEGEPHDQ